MIRWLACLSAALVAFPGIAASKSKHDVPKMTCEEFAERSTDQQERVAAYLDGYSKRGRPVEAVADVDVERDMDAIVIACKETPKATVWDKLRAHMPGGKKKLEPVKMICEEYLSYSSDEQDDVAYWLAGYHGTTVAGADEVDVERDVAVLVEECRLAPRASVWERIKAKL